MPCDVCADCGTNSFLKSSSGQNAKLVTGETVHSGLGPQSVVVCLSLVLQQSEVRNALSHKLKVQERCSLASYYTLKLLLKSVVQLHDGWKESETDHLHWR